MPRSRNRLDGRQVYFEDEGGDGVPVVFHGGFLDSVADVRESSIAQALPTVEFRRIFIDHRGLGASDKPHDPPAYAMEGRVGDAVGVLDELSIERAHFVGMSWGGRLGFGIGEHAAERVLSLVIGGQQPYEWPDSPLTRAVSHGLAAARTKGAEGVVEALEAFWDIRFPDERRARCASDDNPAMIGRRACAAAVCGLKRVSARAMLPAMSNGESDPLRLADMAKGKMRRKIPDLAQALSGHFDTNHARLARSMLAPVGAG